jgi:hypothetical protein
MYSIWLLTLILFLPSASIAGEEGKLVGLLADYASLKQRVQEFQAVRKDGYSSDPNELIALMKELNVFNKEVQRFNVEIKRSDERNRAVGFALGNAYIAMLQLVNLELDRTWFKFDLAAKLSGKYTDIWQTVDSAIPVVSPSSHSTATAAQTSLTLRDFTWSRSKYGSLFAIFTIENPREGDVRDFTISCSTYGRSGTQIGTVSKTFYEIVKAKSMQEYEGVEIGPVDPQTATVRCSANSTTGKP